MGGAKCPDCGSIRTEKIGESTISDDAKVRGAMTGALSGTAVATGVAIKGAIGAKILGLLTVASGPAVIAGAVVIGGALALLKGYDDKKVYVKYKCKKCGNKFTITKKRRKRT